MALEDMIPKITVQHRRVLKGRMDTMSIEKQKNENSQV